MCFTPPITALATMVTALVFCLPDGGCAENPSGGAKAVAPVALPAPLERWASDHPKAARELGDWVRGHPDTAKRLFAWDGRYPEASHEFMSWTVSHPFEDLDSFVRAHSDWPTFRDILKRDRGATEELMTWCRSNPAAAQSLMEHPRGLQWAGENLYGM